MPVPYEGAQSGVEYEIPTLDDVRDISVAFAGFADSIPATPPVLAIETITASGTAELNTIYIYEGTTPITVTIPDGVRAGDRVIFYQTSTGTITLTGIDVGTPLTTTQYDAVTALWDGSRWVGAPFSFSGTRPLESSGGTIVDLNGFRYHIFSTPGIFSFISHADLDAEVVYVAGAGGGADSSVTAAGPGGQGGEAFGPTAVTIEDWTFTKVQVGAGGTMGNAGGQSSFGALEAYGGVAGVAGETTPSSTPLTLTGDWVTAIGKALVGGNGGDGVGPAAPSTFGKGGGGGFDLLAPYNQETETYSYTTGGPYSYDCSYGARAENYQSGTQTVIGDPATQQNPAGACPGGWWNEYHPEVSASQPWRCVTTVPTYSTRYHCDSGGSLSGTTCIKTCYGDNTQYHTGTRPKACNAGYTAVSGVCKDSRAVGGGKGGDGLVALRYPLD